MATKSRGSVGSTQRRSAEEGSLTEFCPPRPLHMLPFYHGVKTFGQVQDQLVENGDYLLIMDAESNRLTVCVQAEDGSKHRQVIEKRAMDGKFVIKGVCDHHAQGFANIEELIAYYEVYGLAVVKKDKSESKLTKAVNCREDQKPDSERRRPFQKIKDLAHFHGQLKREDANKLLAKDGDYLLHEDPEKRGVFILSVRDNGVYLNQVLERDSTCGDYVLPRESDKLPVESVTLIDELIQFHVLYNVPVAGKFKLVRAINKRK